MPLYSYICPSGHKHEELKPYTARSECGQCPECGRLTKPALTTANIGYHRRVIFAGDAGYPPPGADWEKGDKLSEI